MGSAVSITPTSDPENPRLVRYAERNGVKTPTDIQYRTFSLRSLGKLLALLSAAPNFSPPNDMKQLLHVPKSIKLRFSWKYSVLLRTDDNEGGGDLSAV